MMIFFLLVRGKLLLSKLLDRTACRTGNEEIKKHRRSQKGITLIHANKFKMDVNYKLYLNCMKKELTPPRTEANLPIYIIFDIACKPKLQDSIANTRKTTAGKHLPS